MAETLQIAFSNLLLDAENPRLPQPNTSQREALQELARHSPKKLLVLAKDIAENGLNLADLPIAMPFKDDRNRYVILEGNRRLAALKSLENPDLLDGIFNSVLLKQLRGYSKQYRDVPIDSTLCLVVKDRIEAQHWIELRHTGQNEGAGIIPWGSEESARFRVRSGELPIHSQVLNFLEQEGFLKPVERRDVPATSFKRLLGTPEVRQKLGITVKDGKIKLLASRQKVGKALRHVAKDLLSGKTKTEHIYTKQKRIKYANSLPRNVVVKPTSREAVDLPTPDADLPAKRKRSAPRKKRRKRDKLIPSDCVLSIPVGRICDIEDEFNTLSLENHTNAISVLFRVFLELSVDQYIEKHKLSAKSKPDLRAKMTTVVNDLLSRSKLTRTQAQPVRRACQKDSFLAPSITLMHAFIHNPNIFPTPSDLRAHWDSLQPFMMAIWAP